MSRPATLSTPTRRDVWVRMLLYPRHTLPTAAAPVAVATGLAVADGVAAWTPALFAFLAGWLVQLGGVFADNYNNLRRHPDDREHPAFVRALDAGVVSLQTLQRAVWVTYLAGTVAGLSLVWIGGLPALVIGLASILASLAYSSDPFPLGDRALGDPLFFVFFGVVSVVGTYYVQATATLSPPLPLLPPAGSLPVAAFLVSLPVAALTTNILVIDNIRDREFDAEKHEITLAVLLGDTWSRIEYLALLVLAYTIPPVLVWRGGEPWTLLPLLTLPYAAVVARRVWVRRTHEELIPMTPQAGQVVLAYSVLFGIGLAMGGGT
jgi:1,4-dihydroxy-2-naphthoate octaprenyltransferase